MLYDRLLLSNLQEFALKMYKHKTCITTAVHHCWGIPTQFANDIQVPQIVIEPTSSAGKMILSGKLNGFNHSKPFLSLCDSFHIANTARTLCVCIFGPRSTLSGSHKEMNLRLHKTSHLQVLLLLYPYFTSRFFQSARGKFCDFQEMYNSQRNFPIPFSLASPCCSQRSRGKKGRKNNGLMKNDDSTFSALLSHRNNIHAIRYFCGIAATAERTTLEKTLERGSVLLTSS